MTTLGIGAADITASASRRTATARATVQAASPEWTLCSGGPPTVMLFVEAQLRFPLSGSITRFANDLCADGYRVWLAESVPSTPPAVRAHLADAWERSGHSLPGAMLIGAIPAYQFVIFHSFHPSFPDVREEVISFQYYADLNGGFSTSPGYTGTHPHSYDVHDGDVKMPLAFPWSNDREFYLGTPVIVGDPALRLRP